MPLGAAGAPPPLAEGLGGILGAPGFAGTTGLGLAAAAEAEWEETGVEDRDSIGVLAALRACKACASAGASPPPPEAVPLVGGKGGGSGAAAGGAAGLGTALRL